MNICVIVAQTENPSALNKESIELINSKTKNVFKLWFWWYWK